MSRGAKPTKAKRAKAKVAADRAGRRTPLKKEASGRHSLEQRLAEALEQQTATAEILRVISSSPTEVQPVFEVIARRARSLCEADSAGVFTYDGEMLHLECLDNVGFHGADALRSAYPMPANPAHASGRVILEGHPVHIPDVQADRNYDLRAVLEAGLRSVLAVPMLRGGTTIGTIVLHAWAIPRPFSDKQIALLQTFADQAVIAIENVRLFKELEARNRDLTETLEQQTATGEILRVISSSPTDVQPVFDTIAESARRLCEGRFCQVFRLDAGRLHFVAYHGHSREGLEATRRAFPGPADRGTAAGRAILSGAVTQVPDVLADPEYGMVGVARAVRFRSLVAVPMMREGVPIGAIAVSRSEIGFFPDRQVDLLRAFADQAVIAIENVRLFTELGARNHDLAEALEQKTATGEILRAISGSPTDVQPVFDAIVGSAARLCEAEFSALTRLDDGQLHLVAMSNMSPAETEAYESLFPRPPHRGYVIGRAVLDGRPVHVEDVLTDPDYDPRTLEVLQRARSYRSYLGVPIVQNGVAIGAIGCGRREMRPFTAAQIELVKTFADQAVIAIENVRLFKELEARNRDLSETLEQQTATGEILRVISSSPTDIQPVFDTIVASACRLCDGVFANAVRFDGEMMHNMAHHGFTPEGREVLIRAFPARPTRESMSGRAILTSRVVQAEDSSADDETAVSQQLARLMGFHGQVSVPMLRDGVPIGAIIVARRERGRFPERQIALLQTFADQAVIAIENARLFKELEARNSDLTEALEQQTATAETLRLISSSPTDLGPIFQGVADSAARLLRADNAQILLVEGSALRVVASHGTLRAFASDAVQPISRSLVTGRAVTDRRTMHVHDLLAEVDTEYPEARELQRLGGHRTTLVTPMLRQGVALGAISILRSEVRPFTQKQIELLETFADQAVIAIENVRLFRELDVRNRELTETLEQQTATSEVLRVMSGSLTDVQRVFDTIAQSAARLCEAQICFVYRFDGQHLHFVAHYGVTTRGLEAVRRVFPAPVSRGSVAGRAILDRGVAQIPDVHADPDFALGAAASVAGYRSAAAVPMVRDGLPIGAIAVARSQTGGYSDRLIDLLKTFADQAVIAIENVRLFQELEARTRDLTRSVGELQALGEVSQAVSSTLDLETVLATIVSRAVELSGSYGGIAYEFEEAAQSFHARAAHQTTPEHLEALRAAPIRLGEGAVGRAGVIRQPVQVDDIQDDRQLVAPQSRALLAREGMGSLLAVPLVRENRLLGGLVIMRRERGAFSPEVVTTLQTFAAQSVLAIHNARLFREIQRQKQYSDALVETSPVAIATMDLRGAVVGWNPGAERLFGYSSAEALGRQVVELVATPEIREEVRENLRQMHSGQRVRAIARRARKDGTLVDVEVSSMPVVVDGAEVGSIAIYHDITELLQARREAEAANEAKSAFLATMSHEIRTPMNAVIGMSGLLLNTALSDEQREYAEIVRQSGDTLLTVINDILDFSKIEAGRLDLESQPFDLRECVEGALDLVATRAAEKSLDLAYVISDGAPAAIVGDVTRLRQVLLNLLSNAVKFTEAGEVVLSVSAHPIQGLAALHELTFSVRDTGIGIPEDRLVRLFQSFTQVDASTTRRYGGTGLGLAISQRLTELMGGRIVVTSEVGIGSDFRFTIQAGAAESPGPSRRDLSGVQPSLRGKRVLVVDDNATNRRILTLHLEAWGMLSRATGSPAAALAWIRADERFDVAILDMHMPEMDGVTLAHAIRERPAGAALPLVLFTSLGRREARAEAEGFAAYLHKPIKPSQLFDALATVLADRPVHVPKPGAARTELDPDMARRHPLRILLAEDNVVNQKLAVRLLAQMGYRADLAANGLEAIDAVERQTYDVVLMDVQMPEMDGFEASREINRRWPDVPRPRLVAMTANAMEGDRELCTAAGMDDYVAKPIRVEELVAALERCRSHPDADDRGAPAVAAIDRKVVERLAATMGGPFVAELIDTFVEDARELIATLRRALAESDVDAFRRAAHSLKSNGESLGATQLAALARELESMARGGSLQGAADRIEPLVAGYEAAARALGELRRDLLS